MLTGFVQDLAAELRKLYGSVLPKTVFTNKAKKPRARRRRARPAPRGADNDLPSAVDSDNNAGDDMTGNDSDGYIPSLCTISDSSSDWEDSDFDLSNLLN